MAPARKIIHVDMDAFYASVEQRDNPAWCGRPVIVARRGARSVVCAASYEARNCGIHSAMPALRAQRLCPQAVFVAPDFNRYKTVSRQIHAIFRRYTDLVEPLSLDEAYLDVTATRTGLSTATATAEAIRATIREETRLTASAGVAPNKFLAKVASDWNKPDGQMVIRPSQVEAFLLALDVSRIPGVGKVMQRRLAELCIRTVGDLRGKPRVELEQRFGRWGGRLHELAHGIDERPVSNERLPQQISSEETFAHDLLLQELEPHIRRLATRTWATYMRKIDSAHPRMARTVVLKLKTADFHTLTRSLTPPQRPQSERGLADLACALRDRSGHPASVRYRLVGVGLSDFVDACSPLMQSDLFDGMD